MNRVIKGLLSICLLIPGIVFSQTSEDLAREIFINEATKKEFATLKERFDEKREAFIELYEPFYESSEAPPEIIAMQEQLYMDVIASKVLKFDSKDFEKILVDDVVSLLTIEELVELREIHRRPVFKKLDSISEAISKAAGAQMEAWHKDNLKLMEYFTGRSEEISIKLKELVELRKKDGGNTKL
ncbi:hypothetical protein [Microbulbifer variabilis]|uniref:hypothetical protein n=1 Tax=Microbulbifer variabilis TaxID=266805 RepID=UPI001CFE55E9|nr:hypothetical protein [Microbulbifer variabilis]